MSGTGDDEDRDDLALVLREIGFGRLASTRANLANSAETRQFLELGLQLLREDLLEHTGPDFDEGRRSRLFESLSRDRILQLAAQCDSAATALLSVNMFRHRWDRKDRYTEDLISYLFRLGPQKDHLDAMDGMASVMIPQLSLGELIRQVAAAEVELMLADPLTNLQAIVQAAMPSHPRVREFCRAQLDQLLPRWARLYERAAGAYGVTLRTGYTWLDVATVFNAVVEGELAWARVASSRALSTGDSVLAGAILAMLPGLIESPTENWDDLYAVRY
jgi:hypothetical protein